MSTTVLIVDDHASFRSFASALAGAEGYLVVGEAGDGSSGIKEIRRLRPDLVLRDVQLPDIDGFEVLKRLAAESNRSAIVLISSREASDYRRRLAGSGARGFIPKSELSGVSIRAMLGASGEPAPVRRPHGGAPASGSGKELDAPLGSRVEAAGCKDRRRPATARIT